MTVRIWLWVDLHRSRNWPWLHNVSTSGSLEKGEDYRSRGTITVDSVFAQNNISIFEASNLMLQSNMATVVLFYLDYCYRPE
jgi:hypothetical protein